MSTLNLSKTTGNKILNFESKGFFGIYVKATIVWVMRVPFNYDSSFWI
jgi:hypothetical protein